MQIVFFDDPIIRNNLKPLTLNRPIACLRLGIELLSTKWLTISKSSKKPAYLTENYLQNKFNIAFGEDLIFINSSIIGNEQIWNEILNLKNDQYLTSKDIVIALKTNKKLDFGFSVDGFEKINNDINFEQIKFLPDLFLLNSQQINDDFKRKTEGKKSFSINDPYTKIYNSENIFVEEGVVIKAAILNAENGPIYIGKNAIIQEGAILIGPVSIGENSMVAYGAKIRGGTTIGPNCRVGGEVGMCIFMAYSNKAHDGFLGNSVVGEWCNLGANTNNSNLKNNYKPVKLYNYNSGKYEDTNNIFVGSFIGDYSKIGISTMLNTGTVIGISSNVFGSGFQEKFIPSFKWGGKTEGYENYDLSKAKKTIEATMARREMKLNVEDVEILDYIAEKAKER